MTINELDAVKTVKDIPKEKVTAGMIGTVVHIHTEPHLAYMVEFCDNDGRTLLLPVLLPDQVIKMDGLTKEEYNKRVMPVGEPI